MNTKINYVYRDGANWKQYQSCVIPGLLTKQQQDEIIDSCYYEFFIPSDVAMPETRFETPSKFDHIWFEMDDPFFEETDAAATVNISPEALVAAFRKSKRRWAAIWGD